MGRPYRHANARAVRDEAAREDEARVVGCPTYDRLSLHQCGIVENAEKILDASSKKERECRRYHPTDDGSAGLSTHNEDL